MRTSVLLFLLSGCQPTSLLELDVFVGSNALSQFTSDIALYIDYGPGQIPKALSLCEWDPNAFRESSLTPVEYTACPDTVTITGVLAPLPEGTLCDPQTLLFIPAPDDVTGFPTASIEVFIDDRCSVIEAHQLNLGMD